MKKILALLMSVSMMASLFVSTAVTSHAADEVTVNVEATGFTSKGAVKFAVSVDTTKTLDFKKAEEPDPDDEEAMITTYSGTGISTATFAFKFNPKYFDLDTAAFSGHTKLPMVTTNKRNSKDMVFLTFANDGEDLVVKDPLYTITIMPTAESGITTSTAVEDINKKACITAANDDANIIFGTWPTPGMDKKVVTFDRYDVASGNLKFTYPDKDAAPADVKVTGITATPAELKDLTVGDKGKLAVAVAPADATEKGVTFVSDAEDVISVDADGNYEAKSAGTAKITITAKDGSGVTATVEVSVSAPVIPEPDKVQFVKAVKSDKAATGYWVFKVNKGITETLKVTYANAANAEEKLELDAPAAIGGESDVTFALYLTVTGDRVGKAYTAAVAHGTDSATGTAITLD